VGDVTTHYSAPDLARLLEYANRVSETRATVLRVVGAESEAKVRQEKVRQSAPL
jgi:BMFP domain-containing protein YqiC